MYSRSSQGLDTPPPTSQFRRPWSPEPYDPMPLSNHSLQSIQQHDSYFPQHDDYYNQQQRQQQQQQTHQRETTDNSVEALDLADYQRTLRPYVPRSRTADVFPHDLYPPTPPLRHSLDSTRAGTISSNSNASSSRRSGGGGGRRPFSLPPPRAEDEYDMPQHEAIDTAHFPAWSRKWYTDPLKSPEAAAAKNPSPFDPAYSTLRHGKNTFPQSDASYSYAPPYSSLHGGGGGDYDRDVLPWGAGDPPEYGPPLDAEMKEERYRMLEREFGPNAAKGKSSKDNAFVDENGKPLVGTVDPKGNLITQGPKKRHATRALQIILALTAAIPSIYAALMIKSKELPPPASKPAAFVLYVLSVLTVLILLYLFAIRPCCCAGKRAKNANKPGGPMANGMMVLPVQGLGNNKKANKKNKKGAKRNGGKHQSTMGGDVQVNLIVDPSAFGRPEDDTDSDEDEDYDGTSAVPGGYDTHRKKRRQKRRSVFAGLAMEEEWKRARGWLKKITAFDFVFFVVWAAAFVLIIIGKRCPTGGFEGWCNAYNVSSAAACLLSVAFGVSAFFDIKDLNTSKQSPRTRT